MGRYSDGVQTISFHSGGRFTATNIPGFPNEGEWRKDDWNLYLHEGKWSHSMRHIQVEGRNHVLLDDIEDLDGWHGEVGLPNVGGAEER